MTTTVLIPSFPYDPFSPELAKAMQETASRIRAQVRTATKAVIEIGHQLISIKGQLDHGQFTQWVETECGFSIRSAENYVRAAVFAIGKNATVANLRPATVYRLAAKSTPPEVVTTVLERLDAGRPPTDDEIMVMLEKARHRKRSVAVGGGAPSRPHNDRGRAVELATEIMSRLGPEVAHKLVASWETVGESLRELVETRASRVVDAAADPADESSASGCVNAPRSSAFTPAVELVPDSSDSTVYRPKATAHKADGDDLGIPPFLDRSKNGIGREASASQVP